MDQRFRFEVDEDIRKAATLPAWFYSDPDLFRRLLARALGGE